LRLYREKSAEAQDFPAKGKPACPNKKLPREHAELNLCHQPI
jgi:hypothetical protein